MQAHDESFTMKVLFTDYDMKDVSLEREMFRTAGIELLEAQCKTEQEVINAGAGCDALLVQYAPINEQVFQGLPQIGLCSRIGAGYDTINAPDAQARGIWVANSPDYGVGEVATHALAMLLAVIRNVHRYDRDIRAGVWHYTTTGRIPRMSNLTVGVMGLGRIGKRFAHIARNLCKEVIAYDPHLIDGDFPAYVRRVRSLEELFAQSDAVSIHCLLNPQTKGIVNEQVLSYFKPGSYLVNTARGAIVDVDGLAKVMATSRLAGVGLDVLPIEPVPMTSALLQDPRVLFTPHSAFYSAESEIELRRKAAQNIITWAATGRPDYPVVIGNRRV
jgi:phosphoglycerate dehydrogenase-like enzyme